MPNISSSLGTTARQIPLVNSTQLGKAAGLAIHFPTFDALLSAVGTESPVSGERGNIVSGQGIWRQGQPFSVSSEPSGIRRAWFAGASAALSHAKTIVLPSGKSVVLAADANVVIATTGAPSGGSGAVGDMAVDFAAGLYYVKSGASTWGSAVQIAAGASAAGVSSDAGNALSLGIDNLPFYDGAPSGTLPWGVGKTYAVGDPAISPSGHLVRSIEAHTAASPFDARKWLFPTDDGATLFDFTQMPDLPLANVYPTKGRLFNFGTRDTQYGKWVVKDGLFQENPANPSTEVIYFEGALADDALLVQHMWCVADVAQDPADGNGITFVWNTLPIAPDGGAAINAGIHWGMLPRIGSNYDGLWGTEPYPLGFNGVSSGPTHVPVHQPRGRTMRWDITVDRRTGRMTGLIDGKIVMQYTDIDVIGAIRNRAIFEILGPTFKVREFGLSPHMPQWVNDGTARSLRLTGNDNTAITTLTGTYQLLQQFYVGYDSGGSVSVDWTPFVNCSSGQVLMELGPADSGEFATYVSGILPQIVAEAGTNCRVAFASWLRGTPGTTRLLGIWARTTGVATVRQDTYGNNVGGPRWSPSVYRSSVIA